MTPRGNPIDDRAQMDIPGGASTSAMWTFKEPTVRSYGARGGQFALVPKAAESAELGQVHGPWLSMTATVTLSALLLAAGGFLLGTAKAIFRGLQRQPSRPLTTRAAISPGAL
ncbi:hypothetical protein GCM10009807_02060 [Microbacterium lacus]|uniref:Uncharacterized protein n=1 Tax=Microbacterium lacus TaxID=415217 RepID=A0ABP4RZD3_9MICO